MSTQHTPGPWDQLRNGIEVQSHEGMHEIHACVNGVPVPIAQVWPTLEVEHDDPVGGYSISKAEGLANLRLLAAAHDLLAALERVDSEMIDYGRPNFNHVGMVLVVKEAIAKAKGQS